VNLSQLEKAVEGLSRKVKELESKCSSLSTEIEQLRKQLAPKCYECGGMAVTRIRLSLGAVGYAHDVWACREHCEPKSARAA